ncbi:hypothetical protein FE782_10365 [Paenibacillus antri]|uniref:Uncharacterized protein n=1 Tax=Paenibacillus antri TaxID=2582848 RepID=A0A5R9G7H6_9BACL|nr:hypothetical protein [Paenibacillus antri]TLS52367.1 hypothetical protein FE782_10365 [Paenibacillus antri]
MLLSFSIAASWMLIATAALVRKSSRQDFAFVFLLSNFINTNVYYWSSQTLHIFEISKDPASFVSFTLLQSAIVPLFIAVTANGAALVRTVSRRVHIHVASIAFLIGLEGLSHYLRIVIYNEVHVFSWLAGYRILLYILPLITLRYFRRMCIHART